MNWAEASLAKLNPRRIPKAAKIDFIFILTATPLNGYIRRDQATKRETLATSRPSAGELLREKLQRACRLDNRRSGRESIRRGERVDCSDVKFSHLCGTLFKSTRFCIANLLRFPRFSSKKSGCNEFTPSTANRVVAEKLAHSLKSLTSRAPSGRYSNDKRTEFPTRNRIEEDFAGYSLPWEAVPIYAEWRYSIDGKLVVRRRSDASTTHLLFPDEVLRWHFIPFPFAAAARPGSR